MIRDITDLPSGWEQTGYSLASGGWSGKEADKNKQLMFFNFTMTSVKQLKAKTCHSLQWPGVKGGGLRLKNVHGVTVNWSIWLQQFAYFFLTCWRRLCSTVCGGNEEHCQLPSAPREDKDGGWGSSKLMVQIHQQEVGTEALMKWFWQSQVESVDK